MEEDLEEDISGARFFELSNFVRNRHMPSLSRSV